MKTWLHGVEHNIPDMPRLATCKGCKEEKTPVSRVASVMVSNDSVLIAWEYVCYSCMMSLADFFGVDAVGYDHKMNPVSVALRRESE